MNNTPTTPAVAAAAAAAAANPDYVAATAAAGAFTTPTYKSVGGNLTWKAISFKIPTKMIGCCLASDAESKAVRSFWLLGMLNNAPWVLMNAVATNISSGGVALVVSCVTYLLHSIVGGQITLTLYAITYTKVHCQHDSGAHFDHFGSLLVSFGVI